MHFGYVLYVAFEFSDLQFLGFNIVASVAITAITSDRQVLEVEQSVSVHRQRRKASEGCQILDSFQTPAFARFPSLSKNNTGGHHFA